MKAQASDIRMGDIIVIPSVKAVVKSIGSSEGLVANISEHQILVFEMVCENGPFRGFNGKCTAIGTDKLNVIKRITTMDKVRAWFRSFIFPPKKD